MNRDDVIRMAREAGVWIAMTGQQKIDEEDRIERFATLVAAAERKRLEATAWGASKKWIVEAVAAEREACARVCDRYVESSSDQEAGAALNIQYEIRARGQA